MRVYPKGGRNLGAIEESKLQRKKVAITVKKDNSQVLGLYQEQKRVNSLQIAS